MVTCGTSAPPTTHAHLRNIGTTAVRYAGFGQGSGPIHLINMLCTGHEERLVDCPFSGGNCQHYEDAGVRCQVSQGIYM